MRHPYFLVGAERSGTTLLRLMLSHHPDIGWLQEFEYAVDRVGDNGEWPDLSVYLDWLSTHRIFLARRFAVDEGLDYPGLVRSFVSQHQESCGKPVVGATVHRHFDRLLHVWPEARFIHIVRDPRDVARSNIRMGWTGNTYTGVQRWVEAERLWDDVAARVGPDRFVEVTQEDLIREPEKELTRLCEFLGVDYDPLMLSYPCDTTYDAPDSNLVEQWRRKASEEDIQLVEARVGDLLTQRGYSPSGLPPLSITPEMIRRLQRQDRWACRQHRLRRYGLGLWVANAVSKRLGPRTWQRRVRLKMNEIDWAHLK